MGKIFANKSLNYGYRYIWDEDTKFIIYQNNKGNIILGTINHEGQIQESQIKKLYKFELKDFGIYNFGSGGYINYENIIYIQNFLKLTYYYEVERILKELSLCSSSILYYKDALKNKENNVKYLGTIFIKNDNNKKYPQYWKLEQDNGKITALTIENIILKILLWFYDIGIIRNKFNVCGFDEEEDYRNFQLFTVIHEKFINNDFKILDEPKLTIEDIYDKAVKENQDYDRIMEFLKKYRNKQNEESAYIEETQRACKYAIQFYSITGKPYSFAKKMNETMSEDLKLARKNQKK